MGSTDEALRKMKDRVSREYPNIKIQFHSPPFKPELSEKDNQIIIEKINAFSPDVIFVGMTCPK